jgi:circadian clock protein KaiB
MPDTRTRAETSGRYVLRLYVAGATAASASAIQAVQQACQEGLKGAYDLEIVDVHQLPDHARSANIIATPTLVRTHPEPQVRLIGNVADRERLLVVLSVRK